MRTWRIEAWTHPRKGTSTYITDVPFHEAHLADRRDAIVDSHLTIPAYRTDILDLINTADPTDRSTGVSTLLRAWLVDTDPDFVEPDLPDFEFFAARRDEEIGEDQALYVKIAGPDIRAGVDDPKLLPFDYPGITVGNGKRTTFPDHIWGGNNIAVNGDLEDGQTNTIQQVWIVWDDPETPPTGTYTLIFDGEETGNINVETHTSAILKTALQTLSNIITVDVTGSGTASDPFAIEFIDPGGAVATLGGTDSITGGDLAAGLVTQAGGIPTIDGWTHSYHPGTGLDHGTYAAEKVTGEDVFGIGPITGNGSLWVYGSSIHSGAQQIREVPPGALAQFSVNHRTIETGQTYRFVIRDLNEEWIASAEYTPTALDVTAMSLPDVTIPAGVSAVIVRVGVVGPEGLTRSWWQLDDLVITLGNPPASKGQIARELLADLQTDHAPRVRLAWLDHDFTDTVDSAGANWISDAIEFAARWGDRLGTGVFNPLLFDTGGDWDVEPALDGGGLPTVWNLRAWEIGSRGVDRTADDDPHFIIGAGITGGTLAFQEPPFTVATVANDDGYFIEVEDTDLVTAYGEIDGFITSPAYRNLNVMEEVANHALDGAAVNQLSAQTRISSSGPLPWHDFDKADRVNFSLPGRVDTTHGRTISQIIVTIKPDGDWEAEITASRLFTGMVAAEEGIRLLLERFAELDRAVPAGGGLNTILPADPGPAGGRAGAYIHLARLTTQAIAVDGDPIAFDALGTLGYAAFVNPTPAAELPPIPFGGAYWDIKVDLGWDSFTAGGSVWITRTRTGTEATIFPPPGTPDGIWTATSGQAGEFTAKGILLEAGDVIKVYVDANDASPQDLASATVLLELIDWANGTDPLVDLSITDPHGLEWDGSAFWYTTRPANLLVKITPSGTVLAQYDLDTGYGLTSSRNPYGVTFDGTHLWVVNSDNSGTGDNKVLKIDPTDGSLVSAFTTSAFEVEPRDITWDGTNLWLTGGQEGKIFVLTTAGAVVRSFDHPSQPGGFPHLQDGIAWVGGNLWTGSRLDQLAYRIDPADGTVLQTVDLSAQAPNALGFCGREGVLWAAETDTDQILPIDT